MLLHPRPCYHGSVEERGWRKVENAVTFPASGWRSSRRLHGGRWRHECGMPSSTPTSRYWMMSPTRPSTPWSSTGAGARKISRTGWVMAAFEYRQAQEIRDAFARHGVRYLFIGKSGAILLGFPDTTQDADLFVERSAENGRALAAALKE